MARLKDITKFLPHLEKLETRLGQETVFSAHSRRTLPNVKSLSTKLSTRDKTKVRQISSTLSEIENAQKTALKLIDDLRKNLRLQITKIELEDAETKRKK